MVDEKKPKNSPTEHLKQYQFQPGQSGNPKGRPSGMRNFKSKTMSILSRAWGSADAPEDWLKGGLEFLTQAGLKPNVDEVIMIRVKYCLANNIKFQNSALLKEMWDRYEGKIPLRVLNKDAREEDDLYDLSDEDLVGYIENVTGRAQKQLDEKGQEPNGSEETDSRSE